MHNNMPLHIPNISAEHCQSPLLDAQNRQPKAFELEPTHCIAVGKLLNQNGGRVLQSIGLRVEIATDNDSTNLQANGIESHSLPISQFLPTPSGLSYTDHQNSPELPAKQQAPRHNYTQLIELPPEKRTEWVGNSNSLTCNKSTAVNNNLQHEGMQSQGANNSGKHCNKTSNSKG